MVNVQPLEAMFNPSFLVRAFHVVFATAGMTMAFVLASIATFKLLKNKYNKDAEYHKSFKNDYDCWILINIIVNVSGRLIS